MTVSGIKTMQHDTIVNSPDFSAFGYSWRLFLSPEMEPVEKIGVFLQPRTLKAEFESISLPHVSVHYTLYVKHRHNNTTAISSSLLKSFDLSDSTTGSGRLWPISELQKAKGYLKTEDIITVGVRIHSVKVDNSEWVCIRESSCECVSEGEGESYLDGE
jgi:hypothetical protein